MRFGKLLIFTWSNYGAGSIDSLESKRLNFGVFIIKAGWETSCMPIYWYSKSSEWSVILEILYFFVVLAFDFEIDCFFFKSRTGVEEDLDKL